MARTTVPPTAVSDTAPLDHRPSPGRRDTEIPSPAVQAHAASLGVLADGSLACVWFAGTQEGVPDISIYLSRYRGPDAAPGEEWTRPVKVSEDPGRSEQNPLLFPTPGGELWLLHTAQLAGHQDTAEVRLRVSRDNGASWGATRTLFPADERGGVFIRQPVVVLDSGRWLLPVFRCTTPPGKPWTGGADTSAVMVSDDEGGSWREVPVPGSTGRVHMNIQPLPDGSLLALYRSRSADAVYRSVSTDDGETWTVPEPTPVPNNNSSVQSRLLADGSLALIHNHASAADATDRRTNLYDEIEDDAAAVRAAERRAAGAPGREVPEVDAFWGAPRAPLTLSFSYDTGLTWPVRRDLVTGDGYCLTNNSREGRNRELSYPTLAQTPDGALHLAYTHHRRAIRHIRLDATTLG
ncbi:glycosyl hydrolase [Streptomyces sp. A7024]|uniref:Glycosyl hydrolase n=1 Tax=Streptomyces coryli TaxID=1128680 RepID=A0A6G4U6P3_9ACTN|nr:exo-alpha-sialidase [Streptomyces coryli]NGN67773.1 glycosyl hydrolase [Streptomyces coryli]